MEKTALILADDTHGLQHVYGMPAVSRLVLLARLLGFGKINIISRDPGLRPLMGNIRGIDGFHVVENESGLRRLPETLRFRKEEFALVLRANHVIDRWSLDRLVHEERDHEVSFLGRGEKIDTEAIFFVKAQRLLPLLSSVWSLKGPESRAESPGIHVETGPGLPGLLDGSLESARDAEAGLSASVANATWERDSLLYRHLSRHVSRLISPLLARTTITANMVTLVNVMIGLAGALLISRGGYLFPLAGSLLFVFSTIVDLVDGEVARLKLEESTFGHYLDIICDNIVHAAVFAAVAFGLYRETGNGFFLHLLWVLFGGAGLCALMLNRILSRRNAGLRPPRLAVRLEALLNNRDFAYLMTGFALFHRLDWFFVASALGTYVLAAILWVTKLVSREAAGRTLPSIKTP